jgi:hypothetical protein
MEPLANARHFRGPGHYEGTSTGPLSFLNPTERRAPLPHNSLGQGQPSSQEESLKSGNSENKAPSQQKDEVRAEDVHRKWRSRDNRKGKISSLQTLV